MSEEKIAQFREHAEQRVPLPDFDALERRGTALRRRRITGVATAAAVVVASLGAAAVQLSGSDQAAQLPSQQIEDDVDAAFIPKEVLPKGVMAYDEFGLTTGATARVEVTPPAKGWTVHIGGPQRGVHAGDDGKAWTGLLWYEVTGVYKKPCGDKPVDAPVAAPITDSLQPLLDMPYTTEVVQQPEPATLGGREAQHARLVLKACNGDPSNPLATGGDSGPLPGEAAFDIWLVPLPEAGTAMVVFDPSDEGSAKFRREWQQVLDSLRISVERH